MKFHHLDYDTDILKSNISRTALMDKIISMRVVCIIEY